MTDTTTAAACAITDDARWRAVLASGATAVPRWSLTPGAPGEGPVATTVTVPAALLDVGIALSIATATLILVMASVVTRPTDFQAFPVMLLISLLIRLSLNVSSTRLILTEGHTGPQAAGDVIMGFANFAAGGSLVMLAKGNRSKQVTEACNEHGGFYLGSIGGPAARLALDCIKSQENIEYPELGMEAVWKIEVEDFPAFIVVDDKGNDFFTDPSGEVVVPVSGIRVRSKE